MVLVAAGIAIFAIWAAHECFDAGLCEKIAKVCQDYVKRLWENMQRFEQVAWRIILSLKFICLGLSLCCTWMCQDMLTNQFLSTMYYTSAGLAIYFSAVIVKGIVYD